MKRIFIISDTHNNIIPIPDWADISIHLGDVIDIFDRNAKMNIDKPINYFREFDYAVCGNHEDMLFNSRVSNFNYKDCVDENIKFLRTLRREEKIETKIEKLNLRLSHYVITDILHNYTLDNRDFMFLKMKYISQENNYDIVLFGHTHFKMIKKINNTYFINPGLGEIGEYCYLEIDKDKINKIELKQFYTKNV